jgi:ribosomal protein L11 methyltransferase
LFFQDSLILSLLAVKPSGKKEKLMVQIATNWYALDVITEVIAREAVEYALMEAGALGVETTDNKDGRLLISGYFDAVPQREHIRNELMDALKIYSHPTSSVLDMNLREVVDQDWMGEWKKSWQPMEVGRFVVAPPWSELQTRPDQLVIRIEPGMAFGTGTHETTRLCLDAIQKHYENGSFLDVGTGTGILAIAAAKMSPTARVEAYDTDPEAIEIAIENARLNETPGIDFHVGSISETTPSADFVCANLTADVIIPMLKNLVGATWGRLVLSGILDTQSEMVIKELNAIGINQTEVVQLGEWVAIIA